MFVINRCVAAPAGDDVKSGGEEGRAEKEILRDRKWGHLEGGEGNRMSPPPILKGKKEAAAGFEGKKEEGEGGGRKGRSREMMTQIPPLEGEGGRGSPGVEVRTRGAKGVAEGKEGRRLTDSKMKPD